MTASTQPTVPSRPRELSSEALDFAPGLLSIQEAPPARLPRAVLYAISSLLALLLLWSTFGHLDVVASAAGRLVPKSYIKVVQPADSGIVTEIRVREGQRVLAGEVLLRMDAQEAAADAARLRIDLALRALQLRRIDAELGGAALNAHEEDPPELFRQVLAQYQERRHAYLDALAQAREQSQKAVHDSESAVAVLAKLQETNPLLKSQAESYAGLGVQGYVPTVVVNEKQRAYLENTQDLVAQEATVKGLLAAGREASEQLRQVTSRYRSDLENERIEAQRQLLELQQDSVKQSHRAQLLELRAPQSGVIKDLATHTVGTVVSPGTVLLSIVPEHEPLVAEVVIRNDDVGFVHARQSVKVKLAAYPFQKYGMVDGEVMQVWPDASEETAERPGSGAGSSAGEATGAPAASGFKALVALDRQSLQAAGQSLELVSGMQVVAEIREGRRTVLEYLLSPIQAAAHDSGRER